MTKPEMFAEIRQLIGLLPKTTKFFSREECVKLLVKITHFDESRFEDIPTLDLLPRLTWLWETQKTVSTHPTKNNLHKIRDHLIHMGLAQKRENTYPYTLQKIIRLLGADADVVDNIKEIELKDKTLTILFK
jgi:hypothetical protein